MGGVENNATPSGAGAKRWVRAFRCVTRAQRDVRSASVMRRFKPSIRDEQAGAFRLPFQNLNRIPLFSLFRLGVP
jgi:hypothetical protein